MFRKVFPYFVTCCSLLFAFFSHGNAQNTHDFGFLRSQNHFVFNADSVAIAFPWAGGINSVRCSAIDLNLDGLKDLVIFEKHGNRILPFIATGESSHPFQFAPEYRHAFPDLHNWAIFKDYNQDGKEDIFCYGLAGITVYENISTDTLCFWLVTDQLQSYYYNGYTNIYTSTDDYLAVEDLDGDGDLDILNFWLLGKYVHYHRNYSIENYGDAEHFDFKLENECWGHFEEGGEDNSILLNSDCGQRRDEPLRHIGSTLFVHDFSENGLPDLVLGDVDYPNLILLQNGGTVSDARMTEMDTLFPNQLNPIWLYSMPVMSLVDVDEDDAMELLVSPSDPSLTKSQDKNSLWLYKRNMDNGDYEKVTESFLQNEMIETGSGAYPVLYDWDHDGLQDLFIANYGSYDSSARHNGFLYSYFSSEIAYYHNVGTLVNPSFKLITSDFGNLKIQNRQALYPAFGDLNADGITDMLCGNAEGTLILYLNHNASGLPDFALPEMNFAGIDVGEYSTPQLFDVDSDGILDLVIGNRRGQLAYYRNLSNDIPDFQFITDTLGGVDVRNEEISYFGFSIPCFFRKSNDDLALFCGSEEGNIYYYDSINHNLSGHFRLKESAMFEVLGSNRFDISEGIRVGVAVNDLNGDLFPEMIVGNYAGGVAFFEGIVPPPIDILVQEQVRNRLSVFPNPAFRDLHVDADGCIIRHVQIFDASGKMMLRKDNINQSSIILNINQLAEGFYIMDVRLVTGNVQVKFIVTKR